MLDIDKLNNRNSGSGFMNAKMARILLRAGFLLTPLALVACGGGDSNECFSPDPARCTVATKASTTGSLNNNTNTNTNAGSLFTTAPTAVTLNAGTGVTFEVGGGTPPYSAASGNTNVGRASMSGTTLSLTSVAAGTSPLVVVDAVGKTINIALTVLAQGQAGEPLSLAPGFLTVSDCTTNIPFIFSGGVAPYTIFTSNNFSAPVSASLPLGAKSYFTATLGPLATGAGTALNSGTNLNLSLIEAEIVLTVLDGQSRTATSTLRVPTPHTSCPADNPLLQIFPGSANLRPSEILAFQIKGGPTQATPPEISFTDLRDDPAIDPKIDPVAKVVLNDTGTFFHVQAQRKGTTLMTVTTADKQRSNVTLIVLPSPTGQ